MFVSYATDPCVIFLLLASFRPMLNVIQYYYYVILLNKSKSSYFHRGVNDFLTRVYKYSFFTRSCDRIRILHINANIGLYGITYSHAANALQSVASRKPLMFWFPCKGCGGR